MYAVIALAGKEYLVNQGDIVEVLKLKQKPGEKFELEKILAVEKDGKLMTAKKDLKKCKIVAEVLKEKKGKKIYSYKKKPKTGYHRGVGYRDSLTVIKISSITTG